MNIKILSLSVLILLLILCFGCNKNAENKETDLVQDNVKANELSQDKDVQDNQVNQANSTQDEENNDYSNEEEKLEPNSLVVNPFEAKNPIAVFTKEDIDKLNVKCDGSKEEIAQCIFDWQKENMIYVPTSNIQYNFPQSYELRWNEILPGIFSSKDIIDFNTYEGKPFGVCWDFAVVYCSIAQYYNVECRTLNTKTDISEGVGDYEPRTGLSEDEYNKLLPWLKKYNLDYPYEAVRLTMPDNQPGHYWAEVNLDGTWVTMDASNYESGQGFRDLGDYEITNWPAKDKSDVLQNYTDRINAGEELGRVNTGDNSDMEEFMEGREYQQADLETGRTSEYEGITDELGNEHRAETIDVFMQGKALAPYMASCEDSCDFIMADEECKDDCDNLDEEPAQCYKDCAGEEFFIVCDYICEDAEGKDWPICYEACSGNELNLKCDYECWDD